MITVKLNAKQFKKAKKNRTLVLFGILSDVGCISLEPGTYGYDDDGNVNVCLRKFSYHTFDKKDIFYTPEEAKNEFNRRYPNKKIRYENDCFSDVFKNY